MSRQKDIVNLRKALRRARTEANNALAETSNARGERAFDVNPFLITQIETAVDILADAATRIAKARGMLQPEYTTDDNGRRVETA